MSNGIDFVIGGKDQAKPAMSSVEKSLERLEKKTGDVGKSTNQLAMLTGTLAAAWVAAQAAIAALGGIEKINAAYDFQTAAVKRLTSALKVRGDSSGAMSKSLQAEAADIQRLTGVGDELTLGYMQQAASMGFATDRIDDAAKASIGLAEVTGKDVNASMADLKAALEGNFDAFYQLNPQIMFMRTNQEKMAAVLAIANQGLATAAENTTTVAGSGQRASGALGDLMEVIGAIIAPVRVLINAGLQQLAESLQAVLAPAAAYATSIMERIGPIMDWVKEKVVQGVNIIIGAWTFFETILLNLGSVWEMAAATAELWMIKIVESVMHAITVEIPAYAAWFGENFVNLMRDAVMLAYTVVSNHVLKIVDTFRALWDFIASGGTTDVLGRLGEISGRSYLEGFQSSLTALPQIAERQLTQREKDLAAKIGDIGSRLGKEFSDKMEERIVGLGSTVADELNTGTAGLNLQGRASVITQGVGATEGRLLTRGAGSSVPNLMQQLIREVQQIKQDMKKDKPKILVQLDDNAMDALRGVEENTSNTMIMEAIA